MLVCKIRLGALVMLVVGAALGCQSPKVASLESQNRTLTEQSQAQLAEIANLRAHSRHIEDELIAAEQRIAQADQQLEEHRRQLASLNETGLPRKQ